MTTMQEFYFHETTADGGTRRTDRLRGVERTSADGYKIGAFIRVLDRVVLKLDSSTWGRAEDVLDAEERVQLAKLLLSGLTIEQVRQALPAELFTAEWALRQNDSDGTGHIINTPTGSPESHHYAQRVLADDDIAAHVVRREVSVWTEVQS